MLQKTQCNSANISLFATRYLGYGVYIEKSIVKRTVRQLTQLIRQKL